MAHGEIGRHHRGKRLTYSADDIRVLYACDGIRRRPEMYFREKGRGICGELMREIVRGILDTERGCAATRLQIHVPGKGGVLFRYDGRGMPIDQIEVNGVFHPAIYLSLLKADFSDKPIDFGELGHLAKPGLFLSAMCEELAVVTSVDSGSYRTTLSFGAIKSLLQKEHVNTSRNEIHLVFSPELLDGVPISQMEVTEIIDWGKREFPKAEIQYA